MAFNAAMQTFNKSRKDYEETQIARQKLKMEEETYKVQNNLRKAQLENELMEGKITRNNYMAQEAAFKSAQKQMGTILEGKKAMVDQAEHKSFNTAQASKDFMIETVQSDPHSFSGMFNDNYEMKNVGGAIMPIRSKSKNTFTPKDELKLAQDLATQDMSPESANLTYEQKIAKHRDAAKRILSGEKSAEPEDKFKMGEIKSFGAKGNFKYIGNNRWEKAK
jgi:hypothetical protein